MLLVHLPGVDVVIDVESKICPCCGGSLHKIGEAVKENARRRHGGRRPIGKQFELNAVLGPAAGAVEVHSPARAASTRPSPAMNSHHRISISPVPYGRHSGGTGGTGGTAGALC